MFQSPVQGMYCAPGSYSGQTWVKACLDRWVSEARAAFPLQQQVPPERTAVLEQLTAAPEGETLISVVHLTAAAHCLLVVIGAVPTLALSGSWKTPHPWPATQAQRLWSDVQQ